MLKLSPAGFSAGFCLCYPLFLALDWHLFLYYPLNGDWSVSPLAESAGPAMQWYGLIASATLAAGGISLCLQGASIARWLSRWIGVFAVLSMAACAWLLRGFFV